MPIVKDDFKSSCDGELSFLKLKAALNTIKKGNSPGIDGPPVGFHLHFWDILEQPVFNLYKECVEQEGMVTTMKQEVISLIPKPGKDPLYIDNWRPISLLTMEYKLLALIYANRLKKGLNHLINEAQTGLMKGRHISCNTRLVLDPIDYCDLIDSDAIILFQDFCKAFDTVDHKFLFASLEIHHYIHYW